MYLYSDPIDKLVYDILIWLSERNILRVRE